MAYVNTYEFALTERSFRVECSERALVIEWIGSWESRYELPSQIIPERAGDKAKDKGSERRNCDEIKTQFIVFIQFIIMSIDSFGLSRPGWVYGSVEDESN